MIYRLTDALQRFVYRVIIIIIITAIYQPSVKRVLLSLFAYYFVFVTKNEPRVHNDCGGRVVVARVLKIEILG